MVFDKRPDSGSCRDRLFCRRDERAQEGEQQFPLFEKKPLEEIAAEQDYRCSRQKYSYPRHPDFRHSPGMAQEITEKKMRNGPDHYGQDVPEAEPAGLHSGQACNKGDDRPEGTDESSEKNAPWAVLLKKSFSPLHVSGLEDPVVFAEKGCSPFSQKKTADVSQSRACNGKPDEADNGEIAVCSQRPEQYDEKCAWNEHADKSQRFQQRNEEQNPVSQGVEMLYFGEQRIDQVHGQWLFGNVRVNFSALYLSTNYTPENAIFFFLETFLPIQDPHSLYNRFIEVGEKAAILYPYLVFSITFIVEFGHARSTVRT
jgi:hypothetical protein